MDTNICENPDRDIPGLGSLRLTHRVHLQNSKRFFQVNRQTVRVTVLGEGVRADFGELREGCEQGILELVGGRTIWRIYQWEPIRREVMSLQGAHAPITVMVHMERMFIRSGIEKLVYDYKPESPDLLQLEVTVDLKTMSIDELLDSLSLWLGQDPATHLIFGR